MTCLLINLLIEQGEVEVYFQLGMSTLYKLSDSYRKPLLLSQLVGISVQMGTKNHHRIHEVDQWPTALLTGSSQ